MIFPIETKRLFLRPLEPLDAIDFHGLETDPAVKKFLNGASKHDVDYYRQWIAKGGSESTTILAVTLRNDGRLIGRCGFTNSWHCNGPELHIVLKKDYWHFGYGQEVGEALMKWGFDVLNYAAVFGVADVQHVASKKLCKRLGMAQRQDFGLKKEGRPVVVYWTGRPSAK
jgi:RimJ/RimL family protein N-acetyltransferase